MIPTLTTPRLTLRPQQVEDFEPFAALFAHPRSAFMGGPLDRDRAWTWFCTDEAAWRFRGFGGLTVTETSGGAVVGQVGLFQMPSFPEPELGWHVYDGHEGLGYATEAARTLLSWAWSQDFATLVSYVDPGNARSHAVARRLGGVRDFEATPSDPGDWVWRYRPEAQA